MYLTEHPLGEITEVLPAYVTAYSGDLSEEDDQARVTLGGILQGVRRVITRAGSTMLVANLEDLQGTVEVVVFPKVFAETANAWAEDAVVLVSGRVDHRDDEAKLLCDAVHAWDDAVRMGPVAFSAERDRLLRGRGRGGWGGNRPGPNGNRGGSTGRDPGDGNRPTTAVPVVQPTAGAVAIEVGIPAAAEMGEGSSIAVVSPMKPGASVGVSPAAMVEPEPMGMEREDEPQAPAEAIPLQATPSGASTIQVAFESGAPMERLLPAIEAVTELLRGHPGSLPVLLEVPVAGARRQIRLPDRVAWDERLGDAVRRATDLPVAVALRPVSAES